jgi:hypothetical protein
MKVEHFQTSTRRDSDAGGDESSRISEFQKYQDSKLEGTQRTVGLAAATECTVLNYAAAPSQVGLSDSH